MKLYDEAIKNLLTLLDSNEKQTVDPDVSWEDVGDHNLILRGDMAYELGGGDFAAASAMAVTCEKELVPCDEVILIGDDLNQISADRAYARIAIVRVNEAGMGDGNQLYNAIRKIEYVRYHINPRGYMTRISANNGREPVRVGKEALEKGLNFGKVSKLFLDKYHENENVEAVKLIFITDPNFDYKGLIAEAKKFEDITGTIDHIFKNVMMDCGVCGLKEICDEVEGLRELHFSQG